MASQRVPKPTFLRSKDSSKKRLVHYVKSVHDVELEEDRIDFCVIQFPRYTLHHLKVIMQTTPTDKGTPMFFH
jgi:hypothetical protein